MWGWGWRESGGALWEPVLSKAVTEGAFVRAEAGRCGSSKFPVRRQGGPPAASRGPEGL